MTPEETIAFVAAFFENDTGKRFAGAIFRLALVRGPEGALLVSTGRLEFVDKRYEPRVTQDYGRLTLAEEWLSVGQAQDRITEMLQGQGSIAGVRFPLRFHSMHTETRTLLDGGSVSGWGESFVDLYLHDSTRGLLLHKPLVASGLRPYSADIEAVTGWVWPGRTDGSEPFKWRILIVLPDTRGRFSNTVWAQDGVVTVSVEGSSVSSEVEIQALSKAHQTSTPLESKVPTDASPVATRQATWLAPDDATSIEFFLLEKTSNDLLDKVVALPLKASAAHPQRLGVEERALQDLTGETHEVEFKPFIRNGDEKQGEILKSVIAFANTQGGRLYIGVGKDGVPEGRPAFLRAVGRDLTDGELVYKRYVDNLIHERIKPVPHFTSDFVTVFGERILIVTTPRGAERPYSTNPGNDVYVRSRSTNRKPDPHTEWRILFPTNSEQVVEP